MSRKTRKPLAKLLKSHEITYEVIGDITRPEEARLEKSIDLPCVVADWIMEAVTRAQLRGLLTVPPPIISRFYQELSNGLVGFSQAYKVTSTPFPFPFAQILALLLSVFCVICPIIVAQMTSGVVMPPILTFFAILSYWGLNQIAVELEAPFGDDDNDLPLLDMHRFFVEAVEEAYMATQRPNSWSVKPAVGSKVTQKEDPALEELHALLQEWGYTQKFSSTLKLEHLANFSVEDLEDKFGSVDVAIALRAEIAHLMEERQMEEDED
jgi:predicted membrane chloride channel (bestrophin family)